MAKGKCILCKTRKASRQCDKFDTFICSVCCAENRDEELCSGCAHYKTAENYRSARIIQEKNKSINQKRSDMIDAVDYLLEMAESGRPGKARKELEELNKINPDNELIYFTLGVIHSLQNNYPKGELCFKKAIEIDPYYVEAHFNLGVLYKKDLDLYKSVVHFQKVCKLNSDAELVKKAKKVLAACENTVKELDGTDLKTFMKCHETFMLALGEMKQRNWKLAIETFNKVLKVIPNHLSSLGNIGMLYGQLAQYTKAITYLDRALEIDPEYESAINNKALYSVLTDGEAPPAGEIVVSNYGKAALLKKVKQEKLPVQ